MRSSPPLVLTILIVGVSKKRKKKIVELNDEPTLLAENENYNKPSTQNSHRRGKFIFSISIRIVFQVLKPLSLTNASDF